MSIAAHDQKYDVFLSYREKDTGLSFTGNLYAALRDKRFKTFFLRGNDIDHEDEQVWHSILKAIQDSRISILVLSENYGSSTRCLDELVNILECMRTKNQLVWPIYYGVDPGHVRRQTGRFGEYMAKLEERFQDNPERVRQWKEGLFQVANLVGWPFDNKEYVITILYILPTKVLNCDCGRSCCYVAILYIVENCEQMWP